MNTGKIESKLDTLQKSIETIILIEIAKSGATREQARKAIGSLNNNTFAKISALFNHKK